MFILRVILIACAVILLFCFKVLFFGKKKSVSRTKPNSYPDQTKTKKVRCGGAEVKQNPQFEEKQEKLLPYLDLLKVEEQETTPSLNSSKKEEREKEQKEQKEEKEKSCSNLPKPKEREEEKKEEKKKPSSDLSKTIKTIPSSYSTTLPGFNNVRRRSLDIYSDLLHTVEWRNKRESILKRDNYRCVYCGRRHVHLHVHHKYYSAYPNGVLVDPWNYPDDALITLCAYCHQRVHARKKIKVYHRRYTDNY